MSPCKLKNIGPLNIIDTGKKCNDKCNLIYDFGLSRCGLVNNGTYVVIKTDGSNTLKFGNLGNLTISETRLYKPSLNKINGVSYDAEIIIQCVTKNSNNFLICIPIETNDNGGTSNDWFSFLINCPTSINTNIDIKKSNFTMNDLLPKGPFFYCENISMPWLCNNKDKMIIFETPASMNKKTKTLLDSVLKSHSYTVNPLTGRTDVFYNAVGTTKQLGGSGSADGQPMTCVPIGSDGEPLIPKGQNSGYMIEGPGGMSMSVDNEDLQKKSKEQFEKMMAIIYMFLGVFVLIVLILLVLYVANKMTVRGNNVKTTL